MTITTTDRLNAIRECLDIIDSYEWVGSLTSDRLLSHARRVARSAKKDLNAPGDYLTPDRALALLGVLDALTQEWEGDAVQLAERAKNHAEKIVILALREAE